MHNEYSAFKDKTNTHINRVGSLLDDITGNIWTRANFHDASKLVEPELSGFEQLETKLSDCEYGTRQYQAALDEGRTVIAIHYQNNRHHPEHWPNGIRDMTLLDLLEMLADWKAASEVTKNGSMRKSLDFNRTRFDIPEDIFHVLEKTAIEMGWCTE